MLKALNVILATTPPLPLLVLCHLRLFLTRNSCSNLMFPRISHCAGWRKCAGCARSPYAIIYHFSWFTHNLANSRRVWRTFLLSSQTPNIRQSNPEKFIAFVCIIVSRSGAWNKSNRRDREEKIYIHSRLCAMCGACGVFVCSWTGKKIRMLLARTHHRCWEYRAPQGHPGASGA